MLRVIFSFLAALLGKEHDFDLFVIGGGSGGITAAKRAVKLGKRVGIADFVTPSRAGTTWDVGGTCLNVGCIPKKMMHYASLLGEAQTDLRAYGWEVSNRTSHSWQEMRKTVQGHIRMSNWKIKVLLRKLGVKYYNALAEFEQEQKLVLREKNGEKQTVTAENIIIAVGARPVFPDIVGCRENCITSDDLFWLKDPPGKTLVIGGGYIGMECGGFIRGLGFEVEVLHRSEVLSHFDQDLSTRIKSDMVAKGVKFTKGTAISVSLFEGQKRVAKALANGTQEEGYYDTVILAVGRRPSLKGLRLDRVGLTPGKKGDLAVDEHWQTTVPGIYAIGDVTHHNRQLTPVAIKEAAYLVQGLFQGKWKKIDYETVPTTVFTPLEYAVCGISEVEASKRHGDEATEVYHTTFDPLEWKHQFSKRTSCYIKVVVRITDGRVLGIHIAAPSASEIISGFSVLMRRGVTLEELQDTIGVHPTIGEELLNLDLTKRDSPDGGKEDW